MTSAIGILPKSTTEYLMSTLESYGGCAAYRTYVTKVEKEKPGKENSVHMYLSNPVATNSRRKRLFEA